MPNRLQSAATLSPPAASGSGTATNDGSRGFMIELTTQAAAPSHFGSFIASPTVAKDWLRALRSLVRLLTIWNSSHGQGCGQRRAAVPRYPPRTQGVHLK